MSSPVESAVRAGAPDPDDALRRLERIAAAAERAGVPLADLGQDERTVLALACQRAPYLATLIARDPRRLHRVAADPYLRREKPAEVLAAELAAWLAGDGAAPAATAPAATATAARPPLADRAAGCAEAFDAAELAARLRRFRADEMVRLGARELALATGAEVGRELARLADVCFDAAIAYHGARLARRFGPPRFVVDDGGERTAELAVIGMGKLGGDELNFASDVDVIYVYSSDAGAAGDLDLHDYFARLCKAVTAALGEVTDDDVVFRVDLRLRPEGSRGAIANSLPSIERYYETWGRPWERQAWLKARPSAGSAALGREVMDMLRPFVHPRHISARVVDDVAELNRRIKAELCVSEIETGFDLKNGVGGIREIEFFVQALQLIHGGHKPVRARGTLIALDQLLFSGIISEAEHRALAAAYRWLRHVEHLIQLESGRQTQRLPAEPEQVALVARRLGYPDRAAFERELAAHTAEVARLFGTLGEDDGGPAPEIVALASGALDPGRERALLAELGFRDPARARDHLELARDKPLSPLGPAAGGAAARVARDLIAEIATSPDPDQAIRYLVDLISRRGAWSSVWRLMGENRLLVRLIASLFGTSAYLSKTFVSHPELIDVLVAAERPPVDAAALAARLARIDPGDDEGRWNALADFKQAQVLRIGLADIAGELDAETVSADLSTLAELCLRAAFDLVQGALVARHGVAREAGTGQPAKLAIMALGKLGGRELGYASDLDVVFVYSADGDSDGRRPLDNVTYMSRLAQRLMSGLHAMHPSGRLYELDTRLRPSGSQGLLVSSLAAWRRYHRGEARLWERQALTKLRPVAGDPALGEAVAAAAAEYVYGRAPGEGGAPDARAIAAQVTSMRDKIERELAGRISGFDLKTGRGGIIDIEFASQYLQLVHGHAHPALRTTSTVAALAAAGALGLAGADDCALLIDGYRFLRKLEHRMRIVHDRSVHRLPDDPDERDKLARRAGYPDGRSLTEAYRRFTGDIRAAFGRVLGAG